MAKLFKSIERNDNSGVLEMLEKNPNLIESKKLYGSYHRNVLNMAVYKNNFILTKKFLELKCKSVGYAHSSDIYLAAYQGNYEIFNLLLQYGADPLENENLRNEEVKFILMDCGCGQIKHDHKEIVLE